MSYLVLARKWRPRTFEEVVGQQHIVQTLQNAIRSGRVAQAFLFAGPRGVGKTSVARILAKALNCEHGPTPTPCNQCDACEEITKTIAPDVFEIDGASNTGVDHVRNLQETIKYLPQKYRSKIFIVDEVHMLSTPAFNAFLKTLEEPPSHVIFIFATTEPHKIIDTVIDRCQRYDFKKIPSPIIYQHIEQIARRENITISANSLQLIAREADGSLRDAQSLLDQMVTYAGEEVKDQDVADILGVVDSAVLFDISTAIISSDLAQCLETIGTIFSHGIDTRQFYHGLMEHFRNLLVAKASTSSSLFPNLTPDEIERLALQAKKTSLETLQAFLKIVIESEAYLYKAPLPRVVLETIVLRMASLPSTTSLKEILDKLANLQEKLMESTGSSKSLAEERPFSSPRPEKENQHEGDPSELAVPSALLTQKRDSPASPRGEESASEESWSALIEGIRKEKPLLASFLDHSRLMKKEGNTLDVGFSENSLFSESVQESKKKRELEQVCEEFFGEKMRINICVLDSGAEGLEGQDSGLTTGQRNEKIREEAKRHPLIKEALNIFGGGIAEIKVIA